MRLFLCIFYSQQLITRIAVVAKQQVEYDMKIRWTSVSPEMFGTPSRIKYYV